MTEQTDLEWSKMKTPNRRISFFVAGLPATAGSKRGFPIHRKNGTIGVAMSPDNKRAKPWMAVIATLAQQATDAPMHGPLKLGLVFTLPRPRGHFGSGKNAGQVKESSPVFPTTKPDLTKLIRCAEDALKGIVWIDDSQVVSQVTHKRYGETPGVWITVKPM